MENTNKLKLPEKTENRIFGTVESNSPSAPTHGQIPAPMTSTERRKRKLERSEEAKYSRPFRTFNPAPHVQ